MKHWFTREAIILNVKIHYKQQVSELFTERIILSRVIKKNLIEIN